MWESIKNKQQKLRKVSIIGATGYGDCLRLRRPNNSLQCVTGLDDPRQEKNAAIKISME